MHNIKFCVTVFLFVLVFYVNGGVQARSQCCLMACTPATQERRRFQQQTAGAVISPIVLNSRPAAVTLEQVTSLEADLEEMRAAYSQGASDLTEAEIDELVADLNKIWESELLQIKTDYEGMLQDAMSNCMNATSQEAPVALTTTDCPQTKYYFPRAEQTTDFIRVKTPLPDMADVTACFWMDIKDFNGSLASYSSEHESNALLYYFYGEKGLQVHWNGAEVTSASLSFSGRSHVCLQISSTVETYINGTLQWTSPRPGSSSFIGGGYLVVGQAPEGFGADGAFCGTVENFMMWNRTLGQSEISDMYRCACAPGYVVSLERSVIQLNGHVVALPVEGNDACPKEQPITGSG